MNVRSLINTVDETLSLFVHVKNNILPFTECESSRDSWRKYCGSVFPGEFVSRCKTKCVKLRLLSVIKFEYERPPFLGMNVTVEPTRESKCLLVTIINEV